MYECRSNITNDERNSLPDIKVLGSVPTCISNINTVHADNCDTLY